MADKPSVQDQIVYYQNTLCYYKDRPVYVTKIDNYGRYSMYDIQQQKAFSQEDAYEHMSPPKKRLGYVNLFGGSAYLYRQPKRVYAIGVNWENTKYKFTEGGFGLTEGNDARFAIESLKCRELVHMLRNEYPTLEQAFLEAKNMPKGSVAFDKQFAVRNNGDIIYRARLKVGRYNPNTNTIDFHPEYSVFKYCIGEVNEQNLSTAWTPCRS